MRCPYCHGSGEYDPRVKLADMNAQRDAFEAAYPRIHCPECRKRVSPKFDAVNASQHTETVTLHCHHCEHRFDVPRVPTDRADAGPAVSQSGSSGPSDA